jgi:membrane protein YqaA with SNARE-associated domain
MFEWVYAAFTWVQQYIIGVPIYVAGPVMFVVGALDSSLLSLPEINDYLVIMRCAGDPKSVFYFPLFAAAGSVAGCTVLYSIMRRGGQAVFRRRFRPEHIQRVERAYARFGILAIAIPAILPPPMPFKIFVATAGAMGFPRWKFMLTIMIARSVRYFVEGALAVFYGKAVADFLKANGPYVVSAVAACVVVAIIGYFIFLRPRKTEPVPETPEAAVEPVKTERIEDTP